MLSGLKTARGEEAGNELGYAHNVSAGAVFGITVGRSTGLASHREERAM